MKELKEQYLKELADVIDGDRWSMGAKTLLFEKEFAAWTGLGHAVSAASGTAALEIAVRALLPNGGGVAIPEMTVPMVGWAARRAGAHVLKIDVENDFLLDGEVLDYRPSVVIMVWTAGIVTQRAVDLIGQLRARGSLVIEDCSHAHGSSLNGVRVGKFGHIACWSLYSTKVMYAGEGGVIATDDEALARRCEQIANAGKKRDSLMIELEALNGRMSEVAAAIALVNLRNFTKMWLMRNSVAMSYRDHGIRCVQDVIPGLVPSWYKYTVMVDDADKVMESGKLVKGVRFTQPTHGFNDTGGVTYFLPNARRLQNGHVSLPTWWVKMTEIEATAMFMRNLLTEAKA